MTMKKSQLRRLLAIYSLFVLLLLGGLMHSYADFIRGFHDGFETSASWISATENYYKYLLMDVPVYPSGLTTVDDAACDSGCQVEMMPEKVLLVVQKPSEENPIKLAFRSIGNNGYIYMGVLMLPLANLAIIVLLGVIFVSLRRSVRKELPINRRNILYTRLIGLILILTELLSGLIDWCIRSEAAAVLQGSLLHVDTSFPLSYWNLIGGVLMLFMAEVFAIGTRLGEEQKLTI